MRKSKRYAPQQHSPRQPVRPQLSLLVARVFKPKRRRMHGAFHPLRVRQFARRPAAAFLETRKKKKKNTNTRTLHEKQQRRTFEMRRSMHKRNAPVAAANTINANTICCICVDSVHAMLEAANAAKAYPAQETVQPHADVHF
jgi:hypothetical protein